MAGAKICPMPLKRKIGTKTMSNATCALVADNRRAAEKTLD
jgi:hypothetical protein